MEFTGIIFDGDGVVFDSEHITCDGFREVLKRRGVQLSPADTDPFMGLDTVGLLQLVEERLGLKIDPVEYTREREEIYTALCEKENGPQSVEGIVELLDWLEETGVPRCIASGGSPKKIAFNLQRTGLTERFPITVSAVEVPLGKPAPDIYLEAARRIGQPIESCLVIEDTIPGLQGGIAAGASVAAIEGSQPRTRLLQHTDLVYPNHHDLLAHLRNLCTAGRAVGK